MEQLAREFSSYRNHLYDYWISNSLWTWRWWLAILLSVVPWLIWVFVRKKESTWRLLSAGFFVMTVTVFFDTIGIVSGLWSHPVKVAPLPMFSCLYPWDYSVFPVATMILLQYFPGANPFLKAAVYAIAGTFIFHPLAIALDYLNEANWIIYIFGPFLFVLYLLAHVLVSEKRYHKKGDTH
jgi:hypothetical protein